MKALTEFFTRMMPYLPGCTEPMAAQALLDSAIAFCEQSEVLREDLDSFRTTANVIDYSLDAPTQQQVARVLRVKVDGTELVNLTTDSVDWVPSRTGKPTHFYTTRNGSEFALRLYPIPDAAYTVEVNVALRPTRSATSLPDDLYDLWIEPVVAGALGRAMAIPNQPFSDPAGASSAFASSAVGANKARREGAMGRVRGSNQISMRRFA